MNGITNGGPAFPTVIQTDGIRKQMPGMSLRDWFAGQALAGLLSHASDPALHGDFSKYTAHYSSASYKYADAMLAERAKAKRS